MEYFLTEEQKMIKEIARKIAEEKILPKRAEYDENETFPWDIVEAMARSDLFGVFIPEEYGGMGFGVFELCLVIEELSRVCGGIALAYAGTALGTFPILMFGNEEQKKKYLPPIAKGEKLAAFAVTEPEAGSDITSLNTTAKKEGDYYILNGTKQWITNGGEADIYVVIAQTDKSKGARGSTAFILNALEKNGFGALYSIDLPGYDAIFYPKIGKHYDIHIPEGFEIGWMVPLWLRKHWNLMLGDARQELPKLLMTLHSIDMFLHDSLHTYEHMMFKYSQAWRHLRNGGILMSDYVNEYWSLAFIDFCKERKIPYTVIEGRLGIAKKMKTGILGCGLARATLDTS